MEIVNKEIIQSYVMTTARYNFSADEKRVLTHLVNTFQPLLEGKHLNGKIEQDLFDNYHLILPIADFFVEGNRYTRVRDAIFSLNEKKFIYKDEDIEEVIRIIEMPKIYKRGQVQFVLNPKIVDCFLNFSKGYSKYELEISLSFSSVYSMRLYELISGQEKDITYKLDTLKEMFGVADKYKSNSNFIIKVIDVAKKELDAKSPYTFKYKIIKKGRAIHALKFTPIYQQQHADSNIEFNSIKRRLSTRSIIGNEVHDYLRNTCGFSEREINNNLVTINKAIEISEGQILDELRIIQARSRKASNPKGYIINALKSIGNI